MEIIVNSGAHTLSNNITITSQLSFPSLAKDNEEYEKINNNTEHMDFMNSVLTAQYLRGIKSAILDYEKSEMPIKYIRDQKVIISNLCPGLLGLFNLIGDDIVVDFNAISGIYDETSSFLFGHEVGHKIAKYTNVDELYQEIANVLGISFLSNEHAIKETFCDEVGNIVSPVTCEHGILPAPITPIKREFIQRKILQRVHNS